MQIIEGKIRIIKVNKIIYINEQVFSLGWKIKYNIYRLFIDK